jgi:glutamate N-acetyltransferase/amino-acid N-acetyltransferase
VTVNVTGASDDAQADLAGRSIANSPLVKTAIAGHDANWGRIAMALGKSGARFSQEEVDISIMGLPVCERGLPVPFDEDEALRRFEGNAEITIDVSLGTGEGHARLWTCDLTHGYVTINGDYRT